MLDVKKSVECVQKELQGVNNTIAAIQVTLSTLVNENEQRKQEVNNIVRENVELREGMCELQQTVRDLEQYSRRDNVEIVGVPFTKGECVYSVLGKLAKVLKLNFDSRNVSVAHRLPFRVGQLHPHIIVKFICREEKVAWIRAARGDRAKLTAAELSDTWSATQIYVNDHLTPHFKSILGRAKKLVKERKLAFAWSRDCRIFARKTSQPDCPATLLRTLEDLDQLINM